MNKIGVVLILMLTLAFSTFATTKFDFDGDGKADPAVYQNSTWYIHQTTTDTTVAVNSILGSNPVIGDYDGDGKADIADVQVDSSGNCIWSIVQSSNNTTVTFQYGLGTDNLAPADYDGDGKTDVAVFRPSNGVWYILQSSNNQMTYTQFGQDLDRVVPADYDGDGKDDIAVFRQSTGDWYMLQSTNGFSGVHWGALGDIPVPGDYFNYNGVANVAIYRPATSNASGQWWFLRANGTYTVTFDGVQGDIPATADWDGDGTMNSGLYRHNSNNTGKYILVANVLEYTFSPDGFALEGK